MEDTPQPPSQEENTPLMKPKRTRKLTEEQSKAQGERMRKINEERIEKARIASQQALEITEQKLKQKLEKVETKKAVVKKLKEDKNVTEPEPKVEPEPKAKQAPLKKQKARRIVVQESSDSEDYYEPETDGESDDEEEIIYVTKTKPREKKQTITKAKKEKKEYTPVRTPMEAPKTFIKFF